jgi:hypothetical protein
MVLEAIGKRRSDMEGPVGEEGAGGDPRPMGGHELAGVY